MPVLSVLLYLLGNGLFMTGLVWALRRQYSDAVAAFLLAAVAAVPAAAFGAMSP